MEKEGVTELTWHRGKREKLIKTREFHWQTVKIMETIIEMVLNALLTNTFVWSNVRQIVHSHGIQIR